MKGGDFMEILLNNCDLIVKKCKSKSGNEYCAIFIRFNGEDLFLNYVSSRVFDKLNK